MLVQKEVKNLRNTILLLTIIASLILAGYFIYSNITYYSGSSGVSSINPNEQLVVDIGPSSNINTSPEEGSADVNTPPTADNLLNAKWGSLDVSLDILSSSKVKAMQRYVAAIDVTGLIKGRVEIFQNIFSQL